MSWMLAGTTNREVGIHTVDGIPVVERRPVPADAGATVPNGTPLSRRTCADGQTRASDNWHLLAVAGIRVTHLPEHGRRTRVRGPLPVGTPTLVGGHDHLVAAHTAGAREPGDVMDSLGTAEAVVTVSERVAPRAAAGFGMSRNRPAGGAWWAMMSGFPHCGRLLDWFRSPAVLERVCHHALAEHADVQPRDVTGPSRDTAWMKAQVPASVVSSDVLPRNDIIANRYDLIYRGGSLPRVREVA